MNEQKPCTAWADKLALKAEDLTPAERVALQAHLATCTECAAVSSDYHFLITHLRNRPKPFMRALPSLSQQDLSQLADHTTVQHDCVVENGQTQRGRSNTLPFLHPNVSTKRVWSQGLNTIAAALLVAVLVGSFVLLLTHIRQGKIGMPPPTAVPTHVAPGGSTAHLAFDVSSNGLVTMNADGSDQLLLTHGLRVIASPVWSSNGNRLAFSAYRVDMYGVHGEGDIYVMNADGSGLANLTKDPASDQFPSWSPDGTKIVFVSDRTGRQEIYRVNADGSSLTRLTTTTGSGPAWAPDGKRIAFVSNRDGNPEIYVMNADGSGQRRLTHNTAEDEAPAWSPDGRKIAFDSNRDGNPEIYVMNADGSGQRRLTQFTQEARFPAWTPDGKQLVFSEGRKGSFNEISSRSSQDGNPEIWVVNVGGTGLMELTHNKAYDIDPVWSPDGTKIAFASNREGNFQIYVMNTDGSHQTRLTNSAVDARFPAWQP